MITETKIFGSKTCPECGYNDEIRKQSVIEPNKTELVYYRCKDCGYQWDESEYI